MLSEPSGPRARTSLGAKQLALQQKWIASYAYGNAHLKQFQRTPKDANSQSYQLDTVQYIFTESWYCQDLQFYRAAGISAQAQGFETLIFCEFGRRKRFSALPLAVFILNWSSVENTLFRCRTHRKLRFETSSGNDGGSIKLVIRQHGKQFYCIKAGAQGKLVHII